MQVLREILTYRDQRSRCVSKVVNLDWNNNQAYSLSQNIYVITKSFITSKYLLEMIRKIIVTNYFSGFIRQSAIKFRFRKTLQKKFFNPTLHLDTKSKCRR